MRDKITIPPCPEGPPLSLGPLARARAQSCARSCILDISSKRPRSRELPRPGHTLPKALLRLCNINARGRASATHRRPAREISARLGGLFTGLRNSLDFIRTYPAASPLSTCAIFRAKCHYAWPTQADVRTSRSRNQCLYNDPR